jgi:hypothetical protein
LGDERFSPLFPQSDIAAGPAGMLEWLISACTSEGFRSLFLQFALLAPSVLDRRDFLRGAPVESQRIREVDRIIPSKGIEVGPNASTHRDFRLNR